MKVYIGSTAYTAPDGLPYRDTTKPGRDGRTLGRRMAKTIRHKLLRIIPPLVMGGGSEAIRRLTAIAEERKRKKAIGEADEDPDIMALAAAIQSSIPDTQTEAREALDDLLDLYLSDEAEALALDVLSWCTDEAGDAFHPDNTDADLFDIMHTASQLARLWGVFPWPGGRFADHRAEEKPAPPA